MLYRFHQLPSITLKFAILLAPAVTITTIIFCAIVGYLTFEEQSKALELKLEASRKNPWRCHCGAVVEY